MGIKVHLDVMMAQKGIGLVELANKIEITPANLSILKNNKAKAIRFTTLRSYLQRARLPARRYYRDKKE